MCYTQREKFQAVDATFVQGTDLKKNLYVLLLYYMREKQCIHTNQNIRVNFTRCYHVLYICLIARL